MRSSDIRRTKMTDMDTDSVLFRRLEKSDDKASFDCGVEPLNTYLKRFARQNQRLSIGITYIATYPGDNQILGYYTLSAGDIQFENMPEELNKKLPKYPIPIARIGRLARDLSVKGQGVGTLLLINAFERVLKISDELEINGIEVDAKDEHAKNFYQSFGFEELFDDELHLYISIKTIKAAFASS